MQFNLAVTPTEDLTDLDGILLTYDPNYYKDPTIQENNLDTTLFVMDN